VGSRHAIPTGQFQLRGQPQSPLATMSASLQSQKGAKSKGLGIAVKGRATYTVASAASQLYSQRRRDSQLQQGCSTCQKQPVSRRRHSTRHRASLPQHTIRQALTSPWQKTQSPNPPSQQVYSTTQPCLQLLSTPLAA